MKNSFDARDKDEFIARINKIQADTKPQWGKMNAGQLFAHKKWLLTKFVKNAVVSDKPYAKNGRTAPEFLIKEDKNFDQEKQRLVAYINKTQQLGEKHFDGKESTSFGKLTVSEWNNLFSKHLEHHLNQFGV